MTLFLDKCDKISKKNCVVVVVKYHEAPMVWMKEYHHEGFRKRRALKSGE
jgi:hypothetical protein